MTDHGYEDEDREVDQGDMMTKDGVAVALLTMTMLLLLLLLLMLSLVMAIVRIS